MIGNLPHQHEDPGGACALGVWELSGSIGLPGGAQFLVSSSVMGLDYSLDLIPSQT